MMFSPGDIVLLGKLFRKYSLLVTAKLLIFHSEIKKASGSTFRLMDNVFILMRVINQILIQGDMPDFELKKKRRVLNNFFSEI